MPASAAAILVEDVAPLPEAPRRYRMAGGIAASIGLHLLVLLLIADSFLRPPPAPPNLALPVALVRLGAPGARAAGGTETANAQTAGRTRGKSQQHEPQQQVAPPTAQPAPAPSSAAAPTAAQVALAAAMTRPRDTRPAQKLDPKEKTGRPLASRHAPDSRRQPTPSDPLAARLQQLARLKLTATQQAPATREVYPDGTAGAASAGADGPPSSRATTSVRDFLRAQVIRHWNLKTQAQAANWTVSIHLQLRRDGSVVLAEIVDPARYRLNRPYFEFALSARNAVLLAAPLEIPAGQYELVSDVVLPFSARDALQ